MKQQVIFADHHTHPKKQSTQNVNNKDRNIVLTQEQYRDMVREAYTEGLSDAKKQIREPSQSSYKISNQNSPFERVQVRKNVQEECTEKGKKEAMERIAREKEQTREHFRSIARRHDIELFRTSTVFPFTFFTSTIAIDTIKVSIINKRFFATEDLTSIPLKDLADVEMQTVFFLGSLDIKYMPQANSAGTGIIKPIEIRIANLPRRDAIRAKNILKGAMIAKAESIDISQLSPKEVINVLDQLGRDKYRL